MTRDQKSGMGQTSGTQHWIETHNQPMSGSSMILGVQQHLELLMGISPQTAAKVLGG